jgi:hypothetical protein
MRELRGASVNRPLRSTILFATLLTACASAGPLEETARYVRKVTYPSDFEYISAQELQGAMFVLAGHIVELNGIMSGAEPVPAEDHERVLEILVEMQVEAGKLAKEHHTNHPRIDRYIPLLQADIDNALADARATPPNYYFAGTISGSCEYCHVPRHPRPARPSVPPPAG